MLTFNGMERKGPGTVRRGGKKIGNSLHISIHTVKNHVYSLYRKMDVKSRHQLIHRIGVYGGGDGAPGKAGRPD